MCLSILRCCLSQPQINRLEDTQEKMNRCVKHYFYDSGLLITIGTQLCFTIVTVISVAIIALGVLVALGMIPGTGIGWSLPIPVGPLVEGIEMMIYGSIAFILFASLQGAVCFFSCRAMKKAWVEGRGTTF